jgi:hypothetical protein
MELIKVIILRVLISAIWGRGTEIELARPPQQYE